MNILTEERLIQFLRETVDLQGICLDQLISSGTSPVPEQVLQRYRDFVHSIQVEKDREPTLKEEFWTWIWEAPANMNYIQMYGRLAWINLQLLNLL